MSKTIDTALLGIVVLIIANLILFCLISLSTPVANLLITLRQESNNGYFISSISGGPSAYTGQSENQSTGPPNSILSFGVEKDGICLNGNFCINNR